MNDFKSPLKASGISSIILAFCSFIMYLIVSSQSYYRFRMFGLNRDEAETLFIILTIFFFISGIVEFSIYAASKSEYERNQQMNRQSPYTNQYTNRPQNYKEPLYIKKPQPGQPYQQNQPYQAGQPFIQTPVPGRILYVECPNCHRMNNANNAFCNYCNFPLEAMVAQPQQPVAEDPNTWRCIKCGRVNQNYVGTCGCGEVKPSRKLVETNTNNDNKEEKNWLCPMCGKDNPHYISTCSCGKIRPQ